MKVINFGITEEAIKSGQNHVMVMQQWLTCEVMHTPICSATMEQQV